MLRRAARRCAAPRLPALSGAWGLTAPLRDPCESERMMIVEKTDDTHLWEIPTLGRLSDAGRLLVLCRPVTGVVTAEAGGVRRARARTSTSGTAA